MEGTAQAEAWSGESHLPSLLDCEFPELPLFYASPGALQTGGTQQMPVGVHRSQVPEFFPLGWSSPCTPELAPRFKQLSLVT